MDHDEILRMVALKSDLSREDRAAVEAHLETCAPCRHRAEEYDRQDVFVRALPLPAPPENLRDNVFDRIEHPGRQLGLFPAALALPLAAALLVVLVTQWPRSDRRTVLHSPRRPAYGLDKARGAALSASPLIPPHETSPAQLRQVSVVAFGVRLTLIVPGGEHPRDALLQTHLVLHNTTSHAVLIAPTPDGGCGSPSPQVRVLDGKGRVAYPPSLPGVPIQNCPLIVSRVRLGPHRVLSLSRLIVLRAGTVQAAVNVAMGKRSATIATPPIAVPLGSGSRPVASLRVRPVLAATITRPRGATGPLHYVAWWACAGPPGGEYVDQSWQTSSSSTIHQTPPCADTIEWHVVAGYLNYPVRSLGYRRR